MESKRRTVPVRLALIIGCQRVYGAATVTRLHDEIRIYAQLSADSIFGGQVSGRAECHDA